MPAINDEASLLHDSSYLAQDYRDDANLNSAYNNYQQEEPNKPTNFEDQKLSRMSAGNPYAESGLQP